MHGDKRPKFILKYFGNYMRLLLYSRPVNICVYSTTLRIYINTKSYMHDYNIIKITIIIIIIIIIIFAAKTAT